MNVEKMGDIGSTKIDLYTGIFDRYANLGKAGAGVINGLMWNAAQGECVDMKGDKCLAGARRISVYFCNPIDHVHRRNNFRAERIPC